MTRQRQGEEPPTPDDPTDRIESATRAHPPMVSAPEQRPSSQKILGLALLYGGTGAISLSLTIPLGYSVPIWPPAGIALGGLLVLGSAAWPGILLGAFLIQLGLAWQGGQLAQLHLSPLPALTVALGTTLQAVVGRALIQRSLGPSPSLSTTRDAALFLLLGGVLSTLLSASFGTGALILSDRMLIEDLERNWLSWWVGDSLGVMLVAPPILAWFSGSEHSWRERRRLLTVTSATLSLLLLAGVGTLESWEKERMRLTLKQRADILASDLKMTLHRELEAVRALRSHFHASILVERDEFRRFSQQFLEDLPDLVALSWNPLIPVAQREALERKAQAEGLPQYAVRAFPEEGGLTGALAPAFPAPAFPAPAFHVPVFYIVPMDAHEALLGLDFASDPLRREALERARDSGLAAATAPIRLGLTPQTGRGILLFVPVYDRTASILTLEERRSSIQGFMVAMLRMDALLKSAAEHAFDGGMRYSLLDATQPSAPLYLCSGDPSALPDTHALPPEPTPLLLEPTPPPIATDVSLSYDYELALAGRRWVLNVQATPKFTALHRVKDADAALLLGLFMTFIITTTVLELSGRARKLRQQVETQTAALEDERQRLANILWGTDVGTWEWNIQTGEVRINERWAELLGYSLSELLPSTILLRTRLAHPDDLVASTHMVRRHFHQGTPYHCETRLRHKAGHWVWLQDRGKVISRTEEGKPLWMAGTLMDINARKVAEETLLASEEKLRGLYELAPVGIALTDVSGRFVEVNPAFVELSGYPPDELKTLDYFALMPKEQVDEVRHKASTFDQNARNGPDEREYVRKDGRRISVSQNGREVTGPDGHRYFWSILEDITLRKTREKELTELASQLKASNAELEQFAYVTSHDLRQPLRMVSGFVQMLERRLESLLDEDTRKMMHFASDGAKRMDQMLLSLLEYSRVGRKGEPMVRLNTRTALEEALRFLAPTIRETEAVISVVGVWPMLLASRDELTRLFQNLIGNAVKYRSLERPPLVEVGAEVHGATAQFYIRDNGIGIDPTQFERLFRVFQRLHAPGAYEGTGIGLAIVRKIVTRHGGKVWVESQGKDTGTTFFFTLATELSADDDTSLH